MTEAIRFYVMVLGNTMDSHKTFLEDLTMSQQFREVHLMNHSDVITAFVPIVSRAGTDISAAMKKIPEGKPVVFIALHHTFNPDEVVPDSRCYVNRKDVFPVDCLFHEDHGLLRCLRNDEAIKVVKQHLIRDHHEVHRNSFIWIWIVLGAGVVGLLGGGVGGGVGGVVGGLLGGVVGVFVGGVMGGVGGSLRRFV